MPGCKDCGSDSFETDYVGFDHHRVCTDCGSIQEDGTQYDQESREKEFARNVDENPTVTDSNQAHFSENFGETFRGKHAFSERVPQGLLKGKEIIKVLCSKLNLPEHLQEEAKLHYQNAFYEKKFKYKKIFIKEIVAAACIYIVCRMESYVIPISYFSDLLQISTFKFGEYYKSVARTLNLSLPYIPVETEIKQFCDKNLFPRTVSERIEKLVAIFHASNPFRNRSVKYFLTAAGHIAWQADDFVNRRKMPFQKFVQTHLNLSHNNEQGTLRKELCETLYKMSGEIPWISVSGPKDKSLIYYVDDILQYERTCRKRLNIIAQEQIDKFLEESKRKAEIRQEEEEILAKRPKITRDLDNTEITEEDLPETESQIYFRSEEEVKEAEKHLEELFNVDYNIGNKSK